MVSNLHRARLKNNTNANYDSAKPYLIGFLREHHNRLSYRRFLQLPTHKMDDLLSSFVSHSFEAWAGKYRQTALNAVYAVVRERPDLRPDLVCTRSALAGWSKLRPSKQTTPIPREVAVAIATFLVALGKPKIGLAVLTAFSGLLRASEALSLHAVHVVPPDPAYPNSVLALLILGAKTGQLQYVEIHDQEVAALLLAAAPVPTNTRVFDFSYTTFRRYFKLAVAALGLPPSLSLHGLRHGGATHLRLMEGLSMEELRFRGRWASLRSVDTYVQAAPVLLLLSKQTLRHALIIGRRVLSQGVAYTWNSLLQ